MSLDDFKENLEKIKVLSADYDRLIKKKEGIDLSIRNLKAKYRENKIEREIFSEYNKEIDSLSKDIQTARDEILKLIYKNSIIISEEMKDVI